MVEDLLQDGVLGGAHGEGSDSAGRAHGAPGATGPRGLARRQAPRPGGPLSDRAPDLSAAAAHLGAALEALGLGPDPELIGTPARVAEFLGGFRPAVPPAVEPLATASSNPVVIRDVPYHSLCAHHLLPFFGVCVIAYRPAGAIAGLGWFPRLLGALAARPQLQERLAEQVAAEVHRALAPRSVVVSLRARQMCVEMRGARSAGEFEVFAAAGEPDPGLYGLLRAR